MRGDETKDSRLRRDWEFLLSAENKSRDVSREKDLLIWRLDGSLLLVSLWGFVCVCEAKPTGFFMTVFLFVCVHSVFSASLSQTCAHTKITHKNLSVLIYILITNAQFIHEFFEEHYRVLMTWLEVQGANQPDNSNTHRAERYHWLMILIITCIFKVTRDSHVLCPLLGL